MTVLTHSSSRTVFDALVLAQGEVGGIDVICTESRPVCEGTVLAGELRKAGIRAEVVTDASMFRVMEQVDLAVCGADSVSEAGVTNKTGTALLALAARELDRPLYALCGSQKFLPVGYRLPRGAAAPAGDPEHEAFFEVTPLELFAGIVTEDWIVGPPELADMISRRSR
jgi:translation initiation factor eIF-2B subunit delta